MNPQVKCPKCGKIQPSEALYCMGCGSKLPGVNDLAEQITSLETHTSPLSSNSQSTFITLACPNCGGKLQITPDTERFVCPFCEYEHIVQRTGGTVSLEPVIKAMQSIDSSIHLVGHGINQIGLSSEWQATEQTIARIRSEIDGINKQMAAFKFRKYFKVIFGILIFFVAFGLTSQLVAQEGASALLCTVPLAVAGIVVLISGFFAPKKWAALEKQRAEKLSELEQYNQKIKNL